MRTLPRRYPRAQMLGDYKAFCVYCGSAYYRRDMFRDADGKLTCTEQGCGDGKPAGQLDRENAAGALRTYVKRPAGW